MNRSASTYTAWLASFALFFLLLPYLAPWYPKFPAPGLDPSWMLVLTDAHVKGWLWGQDIVFTFGPASFIGIRMFHPDTYVLSLSVWIGLCMIFSLGFFLISRRSPALLTVVSGIVLFVGLTLAWEDAFFYSFSLMLLLASDNRPESASRVYKISLLLLIAACALIGHFKLSAAIMAPLVCLFIDLRQLLQKRLPWFTVVWLFFFILLWVALGQELSGLPEYLKSSLHIISGYSSSMQNAGSPYELGIFCTVAFFLVVISLYNLFGSNARLHNAGFVLFFMLYLLLIFKAGFVRHDRGHVVIAWSALMAGFALFAHQFSLFIQRPKACYTAIILLLIIGALGTTTINNNIRSLENFIEHYSLTTIQNRLHTATEIVFGNGIRDYTARYQQAFATINSSSQVPTITGSVDVLPSLQSDLIARSINYTPRPIFQGYSAYTTYLQEKNRDFFLSTQAPKTLLFATETVDNKVPPSVDALSWLAFLSHYHPTALKDNLLVLQHNSTPGTTALQPLATARTTFNTDIAVPITDELLWVQLDLKRNLPGKLLHTLWKDPLILLKITNKDGHTRTYRLVHETAGSGFLLSPFITSATDFAMLYGAEAEIGSYFSPTATMRLIISTVGAQLFEPEVDVRYFVVRRDQTSGGLPPEIISRNEQRALFRTLLQTTNKQAPFVELRSDMLFAHAPTRVWLDRPQGRELELTFGLLDGAWQQSNGQGTSGVTFAVTAELENGQTLPLWQRTLRPLTVKTDRGQQNARVELPQQPVRKLVFATLPAVSNDSRWGWSYWGKINFQ